MALVGDQLYIGNHRRAGRVPFTPGQTGSRPSRKRSSTCPAADQPSLGQERRRVARRARSSMSVGSSSNIQRRRARMAVEDYRAASWEVDPKTKGVRIFATGLRNPNGMAWEPKTRRCGPWSTSATCSDRTCARLSDPGRFRRLLRLALVLLGRVRRQARQGSGYGRPRCNISKRPDYALGAHTASLGLAFADGAEARGNSPNGAFVGQHGSWNRQPVSGYKVTFVKFGDRGFPDGSGSRSTC
jgi:glucose/arabinose dehydrogenase